VKRGNRADGTEAGRLEKIVLIKGRPGNIDKEYVV
jgi:hypothetical protein